MNVCMCWYEICFVCMCWYENVFAGIQTRTECTLIFCVYTRVCLHVFVLQHLCMAAQKCTPLQVCRVYTCNYLRLMWA